MRVIGLKLHLERSQPEPVAWADPLTHFLSPAPAHCQGQPLVEEKRESERVREGEKSESKKGKKKWKQEELESVESEGGRERRGSLEFVSCLRPGTAANNSQPGAPGFPLNTARHHDYANFRQRSTMHARALQYAW